MGTGQLLRGHTIAIHRQDVNVGMTQQLVDHLVQMVDTLQIFIFRNIYLSVVQQSTKAHKNCSVCTSIEKVILANFLGTIDRIVSKFNLHNKKYSKTLPTSFHLIQDKNVQIENIKNHILYLMHKCCIKSDKMKV